MTAKRDVLAHFTRDELLGVVAQFDLSVDDKRVKDQLIDAVAASKKATLAAILPQRLLSRTISAAASAARTSTTRS